MGAFFTYFRNSNIFSAVLFCLQCFGVDSFLFFFHFFHRFLFLTGQPISGGSQNSGEFVFLVIKVLCWVISGEAEPQHKEWAVHENTYMHTHRRGVGDPHCSVHSRVLQMIKANSNRNMHTIAHSPARINHFWSESCDTAAETAMQLCDKL